MARKPRGSRKRKRKHSCSAASAKNVAIAGATANGPSAVAGTAALALLHSTTQQHTSLLPKQSQSTVRKPAAGDKGVPVRFHLCVRTKHDHIFYPNQDSGHKTFLTSTMGFQDLYQAVASVLPNGNNPSQEALELFDVHQRGAFLYCRGGNDKCDVPIVDDDSFRFALDKLAAKEYEDGQQHEGFPLSFILDLVATCRKRTTDLTQEASKQTANATIASVASNRKSPRIDALVVTECLQLIQTHCNGLPWPSTRKTLKAFVLGLANRTNTPHFFHWIDKSYERHLTLEKKRNEAFTCLLKGLKQDGCLNGSNKHLEWDATKVTSRLEECRRVVPVDREVRQRGAVRHNADTALAAITNTKPTDIPQKNPKSPLQEPSLKRSPGDDAEPIPRDTSGPVNANVKQAQLRVSRCPLTNTIIQLDLGSVH